MLGHPQRGAVLITSLIILVVMTLLVLGMLKTSVLELKIGGILHTAEQNFSNAEVGLVKFINDNNGRFSADCLTAAAGSSNCFCTNPDPAQCHAAGVANTSYVAATASEPAKLIIAASSFYGAQQTQITASQLSPCVDDAARGSGQEMCMNPPCQGAIFFDVTAVSTGVLAGQAGVHQGIKSMCLK